MLEKFHTCTKNRVSRFRARLWNLIGKTQWLCWVYCTASPFLECIFLWMALFIGHPSVGPSPTNLVLHQILDQHRHKSFLDGKPTWLNSELQFACSLLILFLNLVWCHICSVNCGWRACWMLRIWEHSLCWFQKHSTFLPILNTCVPYPSGGFRIILSCMYDTIPYSYFI